VDGVAPENLQSPALSRRGMERIARSVVTGTSISDPRHDGLVQRVKWLVRSRLSAEGYRPVNAARIGKEADRAWLELSSQIPTAAIQSLVGRVIEHAARLRRGRKP
jgi:hypothetical protein